MKLVTVLFIALLALGCEPKFVNTKFKLLSMACDTIDSASGYAVISFKVAYYSDSTVKNYFASSMERGLHGSADSVIYFGLEGHSFKENRSSEDKYFKGVERLTFDSFARGFNRNEHSFSGESIYMPESYWFREKYVGNRIIIVLYNRPTKTVDTLFSKPDFVKK